MATIIRLDRGMMLRDVTATALDGRAVQVSDFRGRRNVVLIFEAAVADATSRLACHLAGRKDELSEEEAVVLVVPPTDPNPQARGWYGAGGGGAVFIADRYGEIFHAAREAEGDLLPDDAGVLEWLRFINAQCPE